MSTIKIDDIAFVRFRAPDLTQMRAFLEDFGLAVAEDGGKLFARGGGDSPFLHVTELGEPGFAGLGLRASSLGDLKRLAAAEGVQVEPLDTPGGGHVVRLAEGPSSFAPLYPDKMGLFEKIETVAKRIYRAAEVVADKAVLDQLRAWEAAGYGDLPVCMAKTQYSFTTDPSVRGAPEGHKIPVREVRLSAGAGFVVAICGEIMTMPGLPRVPSAEVIRLNDQGQIEGLF